MECSFPKLKQLICHTNKLTKLEGLSSCLLRLVCGSNYLEELSGLPKGLEDLRCCRNPLKFIEPLPYRPGFYNFPSELVALHHPNNYSKYYQSYQTYFQHSNSLIVYMGLELECPYPILEAVWHHIRKKWMNGV